MRPTHILLAFAAVAGASTTSAFSPLLQPQPPKPDWLVLRDALKQRDFATLETRIQAAQGAFELSVTEEDGARDIYRTFQLADPAFEPLLDEWVSKAGRPEALAGRATYLAWRGYAVRGRKFEPKAPEAPRIMEGFFARASTDCATALTKSRTKSVNSLLIHYFEKSSRLATISRADLVAAVRPR
jgi:hypothetical protein